MPRVAVATKAKRGPLFSPSRRFAAAVTAPDRARLSLSLFSLLLLLSLLLASAPSASSEPAEQVS